MRKSHNISRILIACLVPAILFLPGCSRRSGLSEAVPTSSPSATPTPTPAKPTILAGPVNEAGIELIITGVRQAKVLSSAPAYGSSLGGGFPSDNRTEYLPKEGMTFLVVDAVFRNLDSSRKSIKVSSEKALLTDESGKTVAANGSGTKSSGASTLGGSEDARGYCVGCKTSLEVENIQHGNIEAPISFVFTIKSQAINRSYKFRYAGMPALPFALVTQKPRND